MAIKFESSYYSQVPMEMARYGGSLAWQRQIPVESALVLLRREGTPAKIPGVGRFDIGGTHTEHPFRVVRLWEVDPAPALQKDDPRLLSWVLLLKSTDEQVRRAASIVATRGDEEALARFVTLGGLRYGRNQVIEMLRDGLGGWERAMLESSVVKEFLERHLQLRLQEVLQQRVQQELEQGLQQGLQQGQLQEARKVLRLCLRAKFPNLQSLPEIDEIGAVEKIETLIQSVSIESDSASIRAAIFAAASKAN